MTVLSISFTPVTRLPNLMNDKTARVLNAAEFLIWSCKRNQLVAVGEITGVLKLSSLQ